MADARAWAPDVCFSHNMRDLGVETRLLDAAPVVKFMHGYFGTCIGGQKMRRWPVLTPCARVLDPACLALYLPCGCGKRDPVAMIDAYRWATAQRSLFARYAALVVASGHMKEEFVRNGAPADRVHAVPLFAPGISTAEAGGLSPEPVIAFCGRMTALKGGAMAIEAVAEAGRTLGRTLPLVMIGDGPRRAEWERLAQSLGVSVRFTGWLSGEALERELRGATLLAIPSTWPEPFGLVGLEAGALGVPAIAFDVGGIREWLQPGQNGYLVPADPPVVSAFARVLVDAIRDSAAGAMRTAARRIAREMTLARHVDRVERVLLNPRAEVRS
jgi:glycosyltransferase involved in cell wall biosynthesis